MYIIVLIVVGVFFLQKSLQKVWWCSKKVLLLQSDLEGARLKRLFLERLGLEFLREGYSRRDTKESVRRYSERRQRSLTYCNKRKVQCEVYISYLRRYKKYLVVNNRKTFSDENLRHKVKNNFRSQ